MRCNKCNKELVIDKVTEDGRYFYVCLNNKCSMYRLAFNPTENEVEEATIKEGE